jgi:hypothetical protein
MRDVSKQKPLHEVKRPSDEPALIDRNQARLELGGVCYSTIIRIEKAGRLTPITLTDGPKPKVFYKLSEVRAISGKPLHDPPVVKGKVIEYGGKTYIEVDQTSDA